VDNSSRPTLSNNRVDVGLHSGHTQLQSQ
jgi:hypothetical protein